MDSKTFFYHGKTSDGYNFTIAGRFQPMLENDQDPDVDVIMLGAALVGKEDHFNKKVGRSKAEGRMKSSGDTGRNYYGLYQETRPVNWFVGTETRVFTEVAQLNEALTRKGFMHKFNL